MSIRNPPSLQAIIGPGGRIDPNWERWLTDLARAVNGTTPGDTTAPEPVNFAINGSGSVTADGSVAGGEFVVGLDNDQDEPGNTKFYGTDSDGNRGFIALSEGLEAGTGIALTDSGYTMLPSVATTADLPLTGNAGEAVRVTDEAPGVYAWDGSAFTLDPAATGTVLVTCDATAAEIPYDNTASVMAATNVQGAIDELASIGGFGTMVLVGHATVTGSAATSLSITGLDLASDGRYVMQFSFANATASDANLSLTFNGDTTAANYFTRAITSGVSGSPTVTTGANARFCGLNASLYVDGDTVIQARRDGWPVALSRSVRGRTSGNYIELGQDFSTIRKNSANVTTLGVVSDVANSLAVGSFVKLWKTS